MNYNNQVFSRLRCKFQVGRFLLIFNGYDPSQNNVIVIETNVARETCLSFAFSNIRTIHQYTFNYLRNITVLDLSNNMLTKIDKNLFRDLHSLEDLNLNTNYIEEFHSDIILYLLNLKKIDLSSNRLVELIPSSFRQRIQNDEFSRLQILYLFGNQIKRICSSVFRYFYSLQELNLDSNKIIECNPNAFTNLITMRSLFLANNNLKRINSQVFQNSRQLECLYLKKNKIEDIASDAFSQCNSLYEIDISENRLILINHIFQIQGYFRLGNLHSINLSNNQITNINIGLFNSLSFLEILNLSYNKIELLEEGCFDGLPKLKILKLNNNNIGFIAPRIFQTLNKIILLTIFNNNLDRNIVSFFINLDNPFFYGEKDANEINIEDPINDWDQFLAQFGDSA